MKYILEVPEKDLGKLRQELRNKGFHPTSVDEGLLGWVFDYWIKQPNKVTVTKLETNDERGVLRMYGWEWILDYQDRYYPGWMENMEPTLLSTALAGECGEVCGVVTHLEGGGTNNEKYTKQGVLHQAVDTYHQLVLLLARYGFTPEDFKNEFQENCANLEERLSIKCAELRRPQE